MKSKMRKKMIAFLLCMVLVICNSVSILADTRRKRPRPWKSRQNRPAQ